MPTYQTIAESKNFIVLDNYQRQSQVAEHYQSEYDLESELVQDLVNQGYEFLPEIKSPAAMLANARVQLQALNNVEFTEAEWQRLVESYLDKPSDSIVDKTRKIHDNYIYDFVFDDGRIQNIYLLDKKTIARNKLQVIKQFEQSGTHANRYDVTILVNGLPLVQIELKRRGVAIQEAFNQIHRYSKESFNSANSLYKYLQIFVITNGTDTRYFANTVKRDKNSFDFTMNWAAADNASIEDLKDFTATFFSKNTLLSVLLHYSVFDSKDTLLIMRPYQIAAAERILRKIKCSHNSKSWSRPESGGYVWHTTGSGKTLTSFKAAQLATKLDFIDKVLFVVDRKDLDYQTMKEYQRFSPESANGSNNTAKLRENLEKSDNKIIVTTIQKLNNLMKSDSDLAVFRQQVVFIFDECHRSQFGEAQRNIRKKFKYYYQFGFTGTPILAENASGAETTRSVFGIELHSYVITDAIRDDKVLKFKVDYNDVRPKFKAIESEQDLSKLSAAENNQALLHPERIREISRYILRNFRAKTHRLHLSAEGFNAMFAVSSVEAAKHYYEALQALQATSAKPLKIATIFSFAANEEQNAIGEIADEGFETTALNSSAKEFLQAVVNDYNAHFHSSYGLDSKGFENYYKDIAKRVRGEDSAGNKLPPEDRIDLLIVVGMFLTGFDAPRLNTLFVDKNLRYHGLIQAYSRTNRIYDATKAFGNIVSFRDLERATIDAIQLFGQTNTRQSIVLEKSYQEYIDGFQDPATKTTQRGYSAVVQELVQRFPEPTAIKLEADKKDFAKLFGEYLRLENLLQNYDEFSSLQALQRIDTNDPQALASFQSQHHLSTEQLAAMQALDVPSERQVQDYRSTYNDIRDWLRRERNAQTQNDSLHDWDDIVFEIDLLKSLEINLDYILAQIFDHNKQAQDKSALIDNIRRMIRASIDNRAKEDLVIDFINQTDLDQLADPASVIEAFFQFAQEQQRREAAALIESESLNPEAAKRYLAISLKREFASDNGTELNAILPKMSPLNPQYLSKKHSVFAKITNFVDKFKRVGGEL